jgi:hypothetical protein
VTGVSTQLTCIESCKKPSNNDAASEDGLKGRNMYGYNVNSAISHSKEIYE